MRMSCEDNLVRIIDALKTGMIVIYAFQHSHVGKWSVGFVRYEMVTKPVNSFTELFGRCVLPKGVGSCGPGPKHLPSPPKFTWPTVYFRLASPS
jgi:hypothetical protein